MTVLRLTHKDDTKLDIRPSDVVEITAKGEKTNPLGKVADPQVVVEVDAGVRDNYRYLAMAIEFVDRSEDTDVPLQ